MAELGSAKDIDAPVTFVVWNNNGYQEIETSMVDAGIKPVGVTPQAPDFGLIAKSYGIDFARPTSLGAFASALTDALQSKAPCLIDLDEMVAESGA